MATAAMPLAFEPLTEALALSKVARFSGLRVLAWRDDLLYASRGYELLRARIAAAATDVPWQRVAQVKPAWWRHITSSSRLGARLCRDGFHALAILPSGELIGAIPKAIVTLSTGEHEFRITHRVRRGTRPLHFVVTPNSQVFWGEYFDNPSRAEVHIYVSSDRGSRWNVAYTFPRGTIRHVHNIVYDQWQNCLWILTGDNGSECQIIRATCDFREVEIVLSGKQQTRSAALVPSADALYFSSDTPLEPNHIYRLDRLGNLTRVAALRSSSICGCRVGNAIFFSTMVEPSAVNPDSSVWIYGSADGAHFQPLLHWRKDRWPMKLFQYGNAFFPDGNNTSSLLAVTTIGARGADFETSLWRPSSP